MKKTFKIAIMAIAMGTIVLGCKKNEQIPEPEKIVEQVKPSLSTNELIKFMAEIAHINACEITYNEDEEQFIWRGSKTSKESLLLMHEQHQEVLRVSKENTN